MTYLEISELCKAKNIKIKDFVEKVGYSRPGFQAAIDKGTIELRKLKILCEVLEISISRFVDGSPFNYESNNESSNNKQLNFIIETKNREIKLLEDRLKDKNEIIQILRNQISDVGNVAENEPPYGKK